MAKIKKNCAYCGKSFFSFSSGAKGRSKRQNKITILCLYCKKEIKAWPSQKERKKFCSKKCQYNFFKKPKIKKICKWCKKEFFVPFKESQRPNRNHCSVSCAQRKPKIIKNCRICNKQFEIKPSLENLRRCCSVACANKALRGKGHWNWQGGQNDRGIRNTYWKKIILQRDNFTCQECGYQIRKDFLQVHHIEHWSKNEEKRFLLENNITLCIFCHIQKHLNLKDMMLKGPIMKELQIIKKSNLLSKEDFETLTLLKEELEENFVKNQVFRSRYEAESILNDLKFPGDSKYWQAIREQQVHFQEYISLFFEHKKTLAKIELLKAQIEELKLNKSITTPARIKLKEIEIEQLKYVITQQRKIAHERIREIRNWSEIMAELKPKLKYPTDSYEHHQPESYYQRHLNQLKALRFSKQELGEIPQDMAGFFNILANFDKAQKTIEEKKIES